MNGAGSGGGGATAQFTIEDSFKVRIAQQLFSLSTC